ncbi:Homoserine kinase [Kingella potus]|uniref:Homoserine kinase n=1 Tax=Kingella potus TaxID=265175 RepID=A0A377R3E6_9NEIS|nr:Homoserine kinase [Kingella potus]
MSVYTSISDEEMRIFLADYDLGSFVSLTGIAQGVTNSNYFLNTTCGRYVLTVFEVLQQEELPFFLLLKQHLSSNGVACPTPVARRDGQLDSVLAGKPACLVSCLNGADTGRPTAEQCYNTEPCWQKCILPVKVSPCTWTIRAIAAGGTNRHKAVSRIEQRRCGITADEIAYLDTHPDSSLPRRYHPCRTYLKTTYCLDGSGSIPVLLILLCLRRQFRIRPRHCRQ